MHKILAKTPFLWIILKTVQLYNQNNQLSLPVINLGSSDLIELHFDDLDGYVKSYYYTFSIV
jgi:hypothetical protein